jgi:enoyl-CoA hydratase
MGGNGVERRGPGGELLVEAHGAVRLVTLNRPHALNATDEALHHELAGIWTDLDADPNVRAIVLTGAGRAFCGGGDMHLLERMKNDVGLRAAVMAEGAEIVRTMTSVRVPIVVAVNGPAVGLGCSLASMGDIVFMEEQAFLADPHVALGLVAGDGAALTWPLLTGLLRAKEHILLGDRIPAEAARQLGLANRVVPTGASAATGLEIAGRLAGLPPQAVRESKALLNRALQATVESILARAVETETASFDESAFHANLEAMLRRPARS